MCISDDEALARWCEHYQDALNYPPGLPVPVLEEEAGSVGDDIQTSVDEPTLDEVRSAVRKLRNGRAPGVDGIPAELLKCAIGPVSAALHQLFIKVWRSAMVPSDWRDGIIITLYKGKGSNNECGNYRPISLLSIPGKVFAHVLLACIQSLLNLYTTSSTTVWLYCLPIYD